MAVARVWDHSCVLNSRVYQPGSSDVLLKAERIHFNSAQCYITLPCGQKSCHCGNASSYQWTHPLCRRDILTAAGIATAQALRVTVRM